MEYIKVLNRIASVLKAIDYTLEVFTVIYVIDRVLHWLV